MSWTSVKITKKSERYKGSAKAREYELEYIMRNSANVTLFAARLADDGTTAVPLVGDAHPDDTDAYCTDVEITRYSEHNAADSSGGFHYRAKASFTTETSLVTIATSPLLRPWLYSGTTDTGTEDFILDESTPDQLYVENSAYEQFDTLPQRLAKGMSVKITRNQASSPAALLVTYDKTCNSGTVTIDGYSYPARSLLMEAINWDKVIENGTTYYTVTFSMKVREDGWRMKLADYGYTELTGDGTRRSILDKNNKPVTKPWPLDGTGLKRADIADPPAEIERIPYAEISWSGLSFV